MHLADPQEHGHPKRKNKPMFRNKTWLNYSWQVELPMWFCIGLLNCIVWITWCLSLASLVPARIRPRVFIFNNASFGTSLRCLRSTWREKFCKDKLHHGQQSANGQKRHSKDRKNFSQTALSSICWLYISVLRRALIGPGLSWWWRRKDNLRSACF